MIACQSGDPRPWGSPSSSRGHGSVNLGSENLHDGGIDGRGHDAFLNEREGGKALLQLVGGCVEDSVVRVAVEKSARRVEDAAGGS